MPTPILFRTLSDYLSTLIGSRPWGVPVAYLTEQVRSFPSWEQQAAIQYQDWLTDEPFVDKHGQPLPHLWYRADYETEYAKIMDARKRSEKRMGDIDVIKENLGKIVTAINRKNNGLLPLGMVENIAKTFYFTRNVEALRGMGVEVEGLTWPDVKELEKFQLTMVK